MHVEKPPKHSGVSGQLDVFLFPSHRYTTRGRPDMIVSGDENIYPCEVEEVLARHPAVREVMIIRI